ncbi:phosphatase PAP2 family protein [Streptomyces sp. NPDC006975]|uniref:phosphatase PAP2 family protein n=1 Tax=unclassified Streptomyces TaxID=2593676 RepID=UPI003455B21D
MKRGEVAELAGSCGLGAWTAFGVLTMVVVGHDGTPLFADADCLSWSVGHRPDVAAALARGLTDTGTGVIPYALAVLAALIAGRTPRQRALAVALCLGCLGAGQALRYAVMALVTRPRPPLTDWATHASGWAFPSGHTTTAALTAGLLIIAIRVRGPRGGTVLTLVIGGWGALVGLTRVYLGVHWFTDVVGGWLFALGWLGLYLSAVARWLPGRWALGTTDTDTEADSARGTAEPTAGTAGGRTHATPEHMDVPREQREDHAPDDPGRRGRSRPA